MIISVNDFNSRNYSFTLDTCCLFQQQSILAELVKHQIVIGPEFQHVIVTYLVNCYNECKKQGHISYYHYSLGWSFIDGRQVFLFDNNIVNGKTSTSMRENFRFRKGDKELYEDFLKNTVYPVPTLSLALSIGYAAPVISRLRNIVNIGTVIVNFCGASSTGKTTAEELLVSPFGCPEATNQDGLVHTFHATTNALFAGLNGIHGLPVALDDITTNQNIDRANVIYTIATGEGKARCNESGNLKATKSDWSGLVVISSETPITEQTVENQGIKARVINTQGITWTPDAATAELIKRTVRANYGFTGTTFAEFIAHFSDEKLGTMYNEAKTNVKGLMVKRDNLSDRLEAQYAAIYLTIDLMNKCFSLSLDAEKLMGILIKPEQDNITERDITSKALEIIEDTMVTKQTHFNKIIWQNGYEIPQNYAHGDCYGTIKILPYKREVYISSNIFKDLLHRNDLYEVTTIKQRLKERNILIVHDKGRYDCKLEGRRCIHLVLPNEAEVDDEEQNQPDISVKNIPTLETNDIIFDDSAAVDAIFEEDGKDE